MEEIYSFYYQIVLVYNSNIAFIIPFARHFRQRWRPGAVLVLSWREINVVKDGLVALWDSRRCENIRLCFIAEMIKGTGTLLSALLLKLLITYFSMKKNCFTCSNCSFFAFSLFFFKENFVLGEKLPLIGLKKISSLWRRNSLQNQLT